MRINKKLTKNLIITAVFAVGLSAAAGYMDANRLKTGQEDSQMNAGVTTVLNPQESAVVAMEAGVAGEFANIGLVAIEENEKVVVAASAFEEDGTFCGYHNLGMAVVDGNLNVRASASSSGDIVGKLTNYSACEILGEENGWYQITSGKTEGYVSSDYIVTGEEALEIAKQEVRTVAEVTTAALRVRMEPNTESEIYSLVSEGEDLVIVEELDEWVAVEIDNDTGYVFKEYVNITQKLKTGHTLEELRYGDGVSETRVNLVNFACQYIGNKYVWGGTSLKNGVDCSGFTMKVYEQYGIYLPHSSRAQAGYGTKIKSSEAKPGDLFFYGSGKHINHVAIYIGNGQIVHASNKRDGIKISNAHYKTPICVTRLLAD